MTTDSTTYGHEIIEKAPVTAKTAYTATSDGDIEEEDHGTVTDHDRASYRCRCGETFETRSDAMDHIETEAEGLSTEQLSTIASESRGTTLYGFRCNGFTAHTNCIQWLHETLDIVVFATPDYTDINGINVAVRARCGAIEVITETIPVDDVTELTTDEYLDHVETWLRENLVSETGTTGESDGDT